MFAGGSLDGSGLNSPFRGVVTRTPNLRRFVAARVPCGGCENSEAPDWPVTHDRTVGRCLTPGDFGASLKRLTRDCFRRAGECRQQTIDYASVLRGRGEFRLALPARSRGR